MRDIRCIFGWHSWRWRLSDVGEIIINGKIPDCARCERCGIKPR